MAIVSHFLLFRFDKRLKMCYHSMFQDEARKKLHFESFLKI